MGFDGWDWGGSMFDQIRYVFQDVGKTSVRLFCSPCGEASLGRK